MFYLNRTDVSLADSLSGDNGEGIDLDGCTFLQFSGSAKDGCVMTMQVNWLYF